MEEDRIKWDARYAGPEYRFSFSPSALLGEKLASILPLASGRRALDLACGEGRNGIFLAQNGFAVTAVDISGEGLAKGEKRAAELGLEVDFVRADLEEYELEGGYDLILNFNFLLRPLIPKMYRALAPGGVIVMETILDAPSLEGTHSNRFLLQPGELEALFSGLEGEILLLEERPDQGTPVASIIFRKTGK